MASGTGSANRGYTLTANITWSTQEPANNRTYAYVSIVLNTSYQYFSDWNGRSYLTINGGVAADFSQKWYPAPNPSSITISTWEGWVGHDANGAGSLSVFGFFDTVSSPSYLPDYIEVSYSEGAPVNYDRSPNATGAPTVTRNAAGTTITVVSAVATAKNSGPAITDYNYQYSTNGGSTWSTDTAMGTSRTITYSTSKTASHVFKTRAYNSDGWGAYGTTATSTGWPSAPSGLTATNSSTPGRVDLAWTAPTTTNGGITKYKIFRKLTTDGSYTYLTFVNGSTLSYADTSVTPGLSYNYYISASNAAADGEASILTATPVSDASNTATVTVNAIPSPPLSPTATASASVVKSIALSWTVPANTYGTITGYDIWRGTTNVVANHAKITSTTGTGTTYTDSDSSKVAGTTYYYSISARNAYADTNATTGERSVSTSGAIAKDVPTAPQTVAATSNATVAKRIDLTWAAPSNTGDGGTISGYDVYRGTTSDSALHTKINAANVTTLSYSDTDTAKVSGTTYYYSVRAKNAFSVANSLIGSPASNVPSAMAWDVPSAPSLSTPTADATTAKKINVSWLTPTSINGPAITGYDVYRGTTTTQTSHTLIGSVGGAVNSYADSASLAAGTTYYYSVKARNVFADNTTTASAASNVLGTMALDVSSAPTLASGGVTPNGSVSNRIDLSWTAPTTINAPAITGYKIYRGTTSTQTSHVLLATTTGTGTTYADTDATKVVGTTYYYSIKALNAYSDTSGNLSAASAVQSTYSPGIPSAPTLSTATASTTAYGAVDLSWTTPSVTAPSIVNYLLLADGVQFATPDTASPGTYTGLVERQTYAFTVRARNQWSINNSTSGPASNTISVKVPGRPTAPGQPQATTYEDVAGKVTLEWVAPTDGGTSGGVTGYNVYFSSTPTTPISTTVSPTAIYVAINNTTRTADVFNLPSGSGQTYNFVVRAYNSLGVTLGIVGDVSATSVAAAPAGQPNPPTNLVATTDPIFSNRINLSWTASTTPSTTRYNVFRSDIPSTPILTTIDTYCSVDNLTIGTNYTFFIKSVNPVTVAEQTTGGPSSTTVSSTPGATSTQAVAEALNVQAANTSLAAINGTKTIATVPSANSFTFASAFTATAQTTVPTGISTVLNTTNQSLNGSHTPITVVDSTTITYSDLGDGFLKTSVPTGGGTMTDTTNVAFAGTTKTVTAQNIGSTQTQVQFAITHPDLAETIVPTGTGVASNTSSSRYNTLNSVISAVTTDTLSYAAVASGANEEEIDATGSIVNYTNKDIFNGIYQITGTPTNRSITYNRSSYSNLATNPRVGVNATNWEMKFGTGAGTAVRVTGQGAYSGDACFRATFTTGGSAARIGYMGTAVTAGQTYTASMWVRSSQAQEVVPVIVWANSLGDQVWPSPNTPEVRGDVVSLAANKWTRIHLTATALATATTIRFYAAADDSTSLNFLDNATFDANAVMIDNFPYLRSYFDGGTTDSMFLRFGWSGTADASSSTTITVDDSTLRTNLVLNPSMERVDTGTVVMRRNYNLATDWTGSLPSGWAITSGTMASGVITQTGPTTSNLLIPPTIPITAGQSYSAGYWVQNTHATETVSLRIGAWDGTTYNYGSYVSIAPGEKKRVILEGGIAAAGTTYIQPRLHGVTVTGFTWKFSEPIVEFGSKIGDFFSGATTDALGWDYAWSGTANASISTAACAATTVRTNLSVDPAATANIGAGSTLRWSPQWYGSGGAGTTSVITGQTGPVSGLTTAMRKTWTTVGSAALDISYNFSGSGTSGYPVTAGTTYAVSMYYRTSWSNIGSTQSNNGIYFTWYNSAGTLLSSTSGTSVPHVGANVWTRVSSVQTAPANAAYVSIAHQFYTSILPSIGSTFDGTGLLVETSSVVGDYFDGSFNPAGDFSYAWTNTANASTSIQRGATVASYATTNAGAVASREWTLTGNQSLRVIPTSTSNNDTFVSLGGDAGAFRLGMSVGNTYTVSGTIRLAAAQTGTLNARARRIAFFYKNSAGTYVEAQSAQAPNSAGATRLSVTVSIPTGATEAFIRLYNGALVGGGDVWWDNILVEATSTVKDYFDGSFTAADYSYSWTTPASPHNSTSVMRTAGSYGSGTVTNAAVLAPYGAETRAASSALLTVKYRSGWLG